MSTVTLHNVRIWRVGGRGAFGLMSVDVKLNLQETDYGNFLGEEVRLRSRFPSPVATSAPPEHLPPQRAEEARQRVDLYESPSHTTPRPNDGFHLVALASTASRVAMSS